MFRGVYPNFFLKMGKLCGEGAQIFLNIGKNNRIFNYGHGIKFVLLKIIYPCVF